MIGTLLKDTYRVVEPLGEGGMGTLYVAEHKTLPKRYAVKVLKSADKASDELLARFEREARIASGLGHPNIVEVLDFDQQPDGSPFIVMELLDGEDLATRLAKGGPLEPAALLPLCRQLCAALAAAHEAGIVHRDLKPQNVFLHRWGDEELVKVLDFGISKMAGGQTDLTADSAVIGTAHYMAPEQARGSAAEVDGRADLFSLGAMVFECLSGKRAFDGGTLPEIIHALCYGERPTLAGHHAALGVALDPVLSKLLAVERDARYHTVQDAWNELAPALGGEATTLPLGKSSGDTGLGLDATLAATPDPALDATVASDAIPPPGSVVATRGETPAAIAGDKTALPSSAPGGPAAPTVIVQGIRGRTLAVIVGLVGLFALVFVAIAMRSYNKSKDGGSTDNKIATKSPPPLKRPGSDKTVTLALLPGSCGGKTTDIAESLRESSLNHIKGLFVPPDVVDQALQALAKNGGSQAGKERRVGQRVDAKLLISSRCVGQQVKVRVVRVRDGAVLATKLVNQPTAAEQLRDLVSLIKRERQMLIAEVDTQSPAATKAYQTYLKLRQGGVHKGNLKRIIASLEQAHKADPAWERPRLHLATLLAGQYPRTFDKTLLDRVERLVATLTVSSSNLAGKGVHLLAVVAIYQEKVSLAIKRLNRAAMLSPKNAAIHRTRSQMYLLQGEVQLANAAMQKAMAADPDNSYNAVQLAVNHWLAGEFEAALKALSPYVAVQDRQHRLGLADPDLRLGRPPSEGGHAISGLMLLFLGRVEAARKEFRKEKEQLATRSSFGNAAMAVYTYFGLAVMHRLKKTSKRSRATQARAERALKKHLRSGGNPNLQLLEVLWSVAALVPNWIAPLFKSWQRPKLPYYVDVLVARAGILARMGNKTEARKLLAEALAKAKPGRRRGLRATYRRFLRMCRKVDRHWKAQGLKRLKGLKPGK